ncbi:growth-regulated alpha protein-like [Protopterus annectens]|uniref:growth-regulated alpha protein-like n=1 Tax=Protopterus annectens TaxID=7888 RepID=UPI001CFB69A7|nr:growth-regulated alpha protein-like [Protopterus annectens]
MTPSSKVALSVLLLVTHAAFSSGAALGVDLRCQCINTISDFIPPKNMANIEIIPKGPHCSIVEVIATLKSSHLICLNPNAKWVKTVIEKILNSDKHNLQSV